MIRILSYKEHPRGKQILDRYFYLAAQVLPFSAQDILGDAVLEVDGKTITAETFCKEAGKKPRRRTEKYRSILDANGITERALSREKRFEQDELLAARLIWKISPKLYLFLYRVKDASCAPVTAPGIRRENLRKLLTVKMDELDEPLKKIGKIEEEGSRLLQEIVFRYETFAKRPHTAKLLEDMDVNVCPYCNRLYTVTLAEDGRKSRPQFDHYKNKSSYPYFAVSIMNLVPSCGLCNQSKHDREEAVLYPYSDEMGMDVMFRTRSETGLSYLTGNREAADEFSVELDIVNPFLPSELKERIRNSDELFNLTGLYNKHKDYILYLFWKNYVFSEEYLELLCQEFPDAFRSFEDAKNMMYLMDIEQGQWGRRSLGKLTHDIDREINGR